MPVQVRQVIPRRRGRPKTARQGLASVQRRIDLAIDGAKTAILKDLDRTTSTWKTRPRFQARIRKTRREWVTTFWTNDPRWEWISEGTQPYLIFPKKPGGRLRFGYPYSPATKAAGRGSPRLNPVQASTGSKVAYVTFVRHPGIKPRRFNRAIARRHQKRFATLMQSALDESLLG